jgi:hypothetical protein
MGAGESVQRGNLDPEPLLKDAREYVSLGYWLQAKKTFLQALNAAKVRDGEDCITEGRILALIGDMCLRQRNFSEAMDAFQKAQDIFDRCRKRKDGEKPTIDEYKQVMNNLAFSQYNTAQSKSKDSKEFKELNQSALNKWKIVAQMRVGGKPDANIAETLTLMSCIHMQQNNLKEARKLLTKTGEIQLKQGVPRTATRRLYKSVTSAMLFTNAAVLIQRKMRRKLKWIRFRRLQQLQREMVEEEEYAFRDTMYTFEDDCSEAWIILFFNCTSYVWQHDTKRIEIIREMLVQIVQKQDVIIEEIFDEEEAIRGEMFKNFFKQQKWIEDAPQRHARELENVFRREANERESLQELQADGFAQIAEAMKEGEAAAKQAEVDRIRRIVGQCEKEEEATRDDWRDDESVQWNKLWKDYMAGKMKILGERIAKMEAQRQDIIKQEEDARRKVHPDEVDERSELVRMEEEERRRLKAWLEARNRAIKEISREEEEGRRHLRNRWKDVSTPWEQMFADGLAAAKAKEEARVAEERRRLVAAISKVERDEAKDRATIQGELDEAYQKLLAQHKKDYAEALKAEEVGNKRRAVQARRAEHDAKKAENAADKEMAKAELQRKKEEERKESALLRLKSSMHIEMKRAGRRGDIEEETETDSDQENLPVEANGEDVVEATVVDPDGSQRLVLKRVRKALKISDDERARLKKHFDAVDTNGSGDVDRDEFGVFYNTVMKEKLGKKDLDELFDRLDADGGGSLSFDEFVRVFKTMQQLEQAKANKDFAAVGRVKALEARMARKAALVRERKAELKKEEETPLHGLFVLSDDPAYRALAKQLERWLQEDPVANADEITRVSDELANRAAYLGTLTPAEQQAIHEAAEKRALDGTDDEPSRPFRFTDDGIYRGLLAQVAELLTDEPQHHGRELADLTDRLKKRAQELMKLSDAQKAQMAKEGEAMDVALLEGGIDPVTMQPLATSVAPEGNPALVHDDPYKGLMQEYQEALAAGEDPAALAELREELAQRAKHLQDPTMADLPEAVKRKAAAKREPKTARIVGAASHNLLGAEGFILTDDPAYSALFDKHQELLRTDPKGNKPLAEAMEDKMRKLAKELATLPEDELQRKCAARREQRAADVAKGVDPVTGVAFAELGAKPMGDLRDDPECRKLLDRIADLASTDPDQHRAALADLRDTLAEKAAKAKPLDPRETAKDARANAATRVGDALEEAGEELVRGPAIRVATDSEGYSKAAAALMRELDRPDVAAHGDRVNALFDELLAKTGPTMNLPAGDTARRRANNRAATLAQGIDPATGTPLGAGAEQRKAEESGSNSSNGTWKPTDDGRYRGLYRELQAAIEAGVTEPARDVLPELVKRARQIERLDSEELSALAGIGAGSAAAASRWQVREGLLGREHGGILGPSHFLLTDDDQYRALHAELRELVATNPRGNARLIEQQEAKLRERAVALRAVPAETKERLAYARMTRHADQVSQGIDPFTQQDVRKADTRGAKDFKLSDDVEYREKLDDYMDRLALDPSENAPARGALLSAMEEMAKAWATRKAGREKEKAQELALEASKAHDAKRRHVRVVNTLRHNSDHIVFRRLGAIAPR